MTRRTVWALTGVMFALVFEVLDYLAGFNAGIAAQWLVILASAAVAFGFALMLAVCIMAVTPRKGGKR